MATSFVEIKEKGFWIPDWLLQVWLLLMAKEIDKLPKKDSTIIKLRNDWYLQGMHICNGCMNTGFEDFITDETRKEFILATVKRVLNTVKIDPEVSTKNKINSLIMGVAEELKTINPNWDEIQFERVKNNELFLNDIDKSALIRAGELFILLLDGKLTSTAGSTINYWPWSQDYNQSLK